ncbi:ABC transporter permease [Streptococcus bovimastitidis]|uniref:ABC transporter permease n=2 Tax=Streptococcus TaxID=1301 RepID=A0A1L8MKN6_9STRE|nr:carbohydrate ABC transporter permease [Streptococcus bovimastitidis]OJF71298.1 ABC transporter permease [Streptococcus bovimastitidis]
MENQKSFDMTTLFGGLLKWIILIAVSIFTAFPFLWMIISSLKTKAEVMNTDVFWPSSPQWSNFTEVLTNSPIPLYIWNSLWTSLVIVLIQIITGAMLAYALVFLKFRGRQLIFAIVMGTYMLPAAATYIPSYIILSKGGMLNTLTGLIVSSTISIFGIFLLRQAFMQVPKTLIEASRMDGASHFRVLWEIVCPMTKSSFITFGLMSFIAAYNSYMWPSLITNDQPKYLVSQGLRSYFIEGGAYGTEWAKVMAASAVIVLPLLIIFAFTQKWFINGIGGDTGVKG